MRNVADEFRIPTGTSPWYEKDLDFGICDKCEDVGVKLLKFHGWVCSKCAYKL